ncbi:hypothetical protein ACQCVP_10295 [Rossellomorea vietnamensis]
MLFNINSKEISIFIRKNTVIPKRKELLFLIRDKTLNIRGKIRLLGFSRKQDICENSLMKRKELLSPIREKTISFRGKNPALGTFPEDAKYVKTA